MCFHTATLHWRAMSVNNIFISLAHKYVLLCVACSGKYLSIDDAFSAAGDHHDRNDLEEC